MQLNWTKHPVVLITGANSGIGHSMVRSLLIDGYRVAAVVARWGRIEILVNAACRAVFAPLAARSLADLHAEMDVNLWGYVRLIQAVLPVMQQQGYGLIHNLSSGVGLTGFANLAGTGIHVTLMHPPLTRTPSAAPLGVPAQAMADPAVVGRRLARQIRSAGPVITPDLGTRLYLAMARRLPMQLGRLFSSLAARGRAAQAK
jgi:hypothetical protein